MEATDTGDDELVEVRATVNLAGLPLGALAWVDPSADEIAKLLERTLIVTTGRTSTRSQIATAGNDAA